MATHAPRRGHVRTWPHNHQCGSGTHTATKHQAVWSTHGHTSTKVCRVCAWPHKHQGMSGMRMATQSSSGSERTWPPKHQAGLEHTWPPKQPAVRFGTHTPTKQATSGFRTHMAAHRAPSASERAHLASNFKPKNGNGMHQAGSERTRQPSTQRARV